MRAVVSLAFAIASVLALPAIARADATSPAETIVPAAPTYKASAVTVHEHLGAILPLDATFRALDGTVVTLGSVLSGSDLPTILTFNYADCPLLCSMQLNGLTKAMPEAAKAGPPFNIALVAGVHYRIVTISLEPTESLKKLGQMKQRYVEQLPEELRAGTDRAWTFLAAAVPGDATQIRRVADTVGFAYTYIPERAEWAHPAAFIFASTTGMVTRYVYGFDLAPVVLRESIVKAGLAEKSTAAGFMHVCYFYDPDANNYSHAGVTAMRLGAAGFIVLLVAGFGVLRLVRRQAARRDAVSPAEGS